MNRTQLIEDLRRIVGPEAVIDQPDDLVTYGRDWCATETYLPTVAVLPTTSDQIAAVVKCAAQAKLPVIPRGAGTGLAGGAQPRTGGIVISTQRMQAITNIEVTHRRALAQPGVINYELSQHLASYGYNYAPDPASWKMCTIGGNIANNSGGPHCLKQGVTTNHILALEVVLHDGTVLWTGDGVTDAAGYDLTGILVGSEGTLGFVTNALVRLTRRTEACRVALAFFPTMVDAGEAVSRIIAAGHLPTALEMMDATTIQAVNTAFQFGLPTKAEAALIVEVDGVVDGLDQMMEDIVAICRQYGAIDVQSARTAAEQENLWSARKSAFEAFKIVAPDYYLADTVVPRTQLPTMLDHVGRLSTTYNMPVANVFHAGDGNLHPLVLYDPENPDEVERTHKITDEIMRLSIEHGGTITGEHGVGFGKQDYMSLLYSPADLQAMAVLYAIFNPEHRFNPGRVFPSDTDPITLAAQQRTRLTPHPDNGRSTLVLANELEQIVGVDDVLQGEATAAYTIQDQRPRLVVMPGTVDELAAVIACCHNAGNTVVPWGGGTQQNLGYLRQAPDVVVITRRLTELKYVPDDLTITVGAGMTLAELHATLAEHNQILPLEAPVPAQATIGGLVATATDGPRRLGYGTLRDMLLGLTIVEVDGTVIQCGGQVVKNVSGYDLVKLFTGSHGTLGVIAQVSLRTYPQPTNEVTLLATFADQNQALAMLADIATTQLTPTACEYLDNGALQEIGIVGDAALVTRVEGIAPACTRHMRDLNTLATRHGALENREFVGEDQLRLWGKIVHLTAIQDVPHGEAVLRLAVPIGDLGNALADLNLYGTTYHLAHRVTARALNGILYAHVQGSDSGISSLQRDLVTRWRHSHVLACAPTLKPHMPIWGTPPAGANLMHAIKQAFDPDHTLNPGRYVVK